MQEYFGQAINPAHIRHIALLLHALCVVQTMGLHKIADAIPTSVDKDSNLRMLQRFFDKYVLDLDIIARIIFSMNPSMHTVVYKCTAELPDCQAFHRQEGPCTVAVQ